MPSSNQLTLSTRADHQSEIASTSLKSTSRKHLWHLLSLPECLAEHPIKTMAHLCILMLEELCTIMNQENSHRQEGNSSEKKLRTDPKLEVLRGMDLQACKADDQDIQSVVTNRQIYND
jgi:hypothetical protein